MTYLINNIKTISHDKIVFIDSDAVERELNLIECNQNWKEHFRIENSSGVGERDFTAEKPYFEFYTIPKTRFEIQPEKRWIDRLNRNWRYRYYKEFRKVQLDLEKADWTTRDLS